MAKRLHVTPKGEAQWPKLFKADTKFVAGGEYSTKLLIREDEAESLMEMLDKEADLAYKQAIKKNPKLKAKINLRTPYEHELDDDGEETGNVEFKFKLKAYVETRSGDSFTQKPTVVDAKAKPITKAIEIGNGSIIKVGFEIVPYFMASTKVASVSLRLKSAQLIDLVESTGGGSNNPFGTEEGYSHNDNDNEEEDSPFTSEEEEASNGNSSEEEDEDF